LLTHITTALVAYGPWGIFLIGFLDSLGVPLPAAMDALLVLIAVKAPERAYLTAAMAVLGSLAGNLTLFLGARHGFRRLVRTVESPEKGGRFQEWFRRYGLATVFIPAVCPLLPLPLKVFVITAGVLHTPVSKFLAVVLAARLLRFFGVAYLGIRLGSGAQMFLARNVWSIAGIVLGGALLFFLLIRWNTRDREAA